MQDSKIHLCGIGAIIIAVVGSFWLFGLADQVFSFNSAMGENNDGVWNFFIIQEEKQTIAEPIEEKTLEQNISNDESPSPAEELKKEPTTSPPKSTSVIVYDENPRETKEIQAELLQQRLEALEESTFQLSGSGTAWEGGPQLSVYAKIKLELEPIAGTGLTEFKINSGKITIGTSVLSLKQGTVKIQGNSFIVHTEQVKSMDPYLNMTATFDGSIIDDKDEKIELHFENELLYLMEDDLTPIHLDLETILSY